MRANSGDGGGGVGGLCDRCPSALISSSPNHPVYLNLHQPKFVRVSLGQFTFAQLKLENRVRRKFFFYLSVNRRYSL
jgi:hypothetical protein